MPSERGPVRGLARLLRRNPTDEERVLWNALVNDRRFAGQGFKRQVPIGAHIVDFVSFPLRTVIELIPADESEAVMKARADRAAWLCERGYRIIELSASYWTSPPTCRRRWMESPGRSRRRGRVGSVGSPHERSDMRD